MADGADTLGLLRAVFRLEAERTVHVARLDRAPGAEAALEDVDTRLGAALAELEARGVAYPLHAIARRYRLSQEDYLVLQLALLPRHGEALVAELTDALGEAAPVPRLSHALALIAEGFDDWERARAELETFPVLRERLVIERLPSDADPELWPSPAILELLGLE